MFYLRCTYHYLNLLIVKTYKSVNFKIGIIIIFIDRSTCCQYTYFIVIVHRATYNALEAASIKIGIDLNDKNQSLETDTRALEMRTALEPKKAHGTDKNLILASMADEVPKVEA